MTVDANDRKKRGPAPKPKDQLMVQRTLRVSRATCRLIDDYAALLGVSGSEAAATLIEQSLANLTDEHREAINTIKSLRMKLIGGDL